MIISYGIDTLGEWTLNCAFGIALLAHRSLSPLGERLSIGAGIRCGIGGVGGKDHPKVV
jgi:hypothetical protein